MPPIPDSAIIQFEEAAYSPSGATTITATEILKAVTDVGILRPEFTSDGVRVKVLSPGGQWQEGIARLSLDFTSTPTAPIPSRI